MKTKLAFVFLFIGASIVGQEKEITTDFDLKKQEINILFSRVKEIDANIKTEEKLLKSNLNNSDITEDVISRIKSYVKDRNELINSINVKTASLLSSLETKETETTNNVSALEKIENPTDVDKSKKKENKTLLQKIKDKIDMIKTISNKIKENKNLNLISSNDESRFMFMNGFNFGLENIDKLKYVGHFNIYIPAGKSRKWGINTGLLKTNLLNNDSVTKYREDKVLNNPLDNLNIGSSYNRQYNKYSYQTNVSTYSAYFQVLRRVLATDNATISIHAHTELLISKFQTTTRIDTVSTRQFTITTTAEIPTRDEIIPLIVKKTDANYTASSGFFGLGVTLDYKFSDNCWLFTQGTLGFSLDHPSQNSSRNGLGYDAYHKSFFYLARSYFQYNTSAASQIIVGVDLRGVLNQIPLNSIYVGLNVGIDKIGDLFKEKN